MDLDHHDKQDLLDRIEQLEKALEQKTKVKEIDLQISGVWAPRAVRAKRFQVLQM